MGCNRVGTRWDHGFHIAIRIDFSFWAQLPLFRNCFLLYCSFEPHFFKSIKCIFSKIVLFLFFITALIAKTSDYFDKESLHFKTYRSLPMHAYKIETWNLIRKVERPKCWNLDTPGARFYLTICFAGVLRYFFHSLAGCDVEAFDETIPMESDQGRMNERTVKRRWKDDETYDDPWW